MSGLLKKTTSIESEFMYPDGAPKEGTKGYYYMQTVIKQEANKAYQAGLRFALNDVANRLRPIVEMQFDTESNLQQLPDYASELEQLIKCLTEYSKGLKSQINNMNPTNFREGTRTIILRCENILNRTKGDIINKLLRPNVKPITDKRYRENIDFTKRKPMGRPRTKKEKVEEKVIEDPSDLLKNTELN